MSAVALPPNTRHPYRTTQGARGTVDPSSLIKLRGKYYLRRTRIRDQSWKPMSKKRAQEIPKHAVRTVYTSTFRKGLSFIANAILNRIAEESKYFVWTFESICRACNGISRRKVQEALVELEYMGYKRRYTSGRAAAGQDQVGTEYEFTTLAGDWWDRDTGEDVFIMPPCGFAPYQNSRKQNEGDNDYVPNGINSDQENPKSFCSKRTSDPLSDSGKELESPDPLSGELSDIPEDLDLSDSTRELKVTTQWGKNPAACLAWVKNSHLARQFLDILGPGLEWDAPSAKAFYRRFRRGEITPADIYKMQSIGLTAIKKMNSAAAGSAITLASNWQFLIKAFSREEFSRWTTEGGDLASKHVPRLVSAAVDHVEIVRKWAEMDYMPEDLGTAILSLSTALEADVCSAYVWKVLDAATTQQKLSACRMVLLPDMATLFVTGALGDAASAQARKTYADAVKAAALAFEVRNQSPLESERVQQSMLWLADIARETI